MSLHETEVLGPETAQRDYGAAFSNRTAIDVQPFDSAVSRTISVKPIKGVADANRRVAE